MRKTVHVIIGTTFHRLNVPHCSNCLGVATDHTPNTACLSKLNTALLLCDSCCALLDTPGTVRYDVNRSLSPPVFCPADLPIMGSMLFRLCVPHRGDALLGTCALAAAFQPKCQIDTQGFYHLPMTTQQ